MAQLRFMELFESRTRKSRDLWEEAKESLPGGVAGRAAFLAPNPVYVEKAVGGNFVDVDGNEYIDLLLVSRLGNTLTKSFDLFQNRIGCCSPNKRSSVQIVLLNKLIDFRDQFFDTLKSSSTNGPLGDEVEPDFHLIKPRSIRRRIMNLVTGMSRQPTLDLGVFMGSVIVNYQVNV